LASDASPSSLTTSVPGPLPGAGTAPLDGRGRLDAALRQVARRVRARRAMEMGTTAALPAVGLAGFLLALSRTGHLAAGPVVAWALALLALPAAAAVFGGLRRVPRLLAARLLDEAGGLAGRTAAAVDLLDRADDRPFARAAVAGAARQPFAPGEAMPLRPPADLGALAGLGAFVALWGLALDRAVPPPPPPAPGPSLEALLLHPDDLAAQRAELDALLEDARDQETPATREAQALNRILEDLADRRIDREDALRALQALEAALGTPTPGLEGIAQALDALGDALGEAGVRRLEADAPPGTDRSAGELRAALEAADARRAEQAMQGLADALAEMAPSRAELERIRRALAEAAERDPAAEQDEALEEARRERDRLLDRQREAEEALSPRERRLLDRQRRELERLEREALTGEQRRTLERLRRELDRGAEDLRRDPESAAASEALRRAAEELNRFARDQLSEAQRQELERQVRQLRELLRRQRQQQQQGGDGRQPRPGGQQGGGSQMDRFVLRASGQDGEGIPLMMPGQDGQDGQQAGGQQGQGGGASEEPGGPQGASGQGRGPGGQPGGGGAGAGSDQDGDGRPDALTLSPQSGQAGGQAELLMPGMESGSPRPGGGQEGAGGEPGGSGAGNGPGGGESSDPTGLDSRRRTVRVAGQASEGPSRSQVIRGAAAEGFADRSYRAVYEDYRDHAETVVDSDEIPDGYRFYVRRYFQLIRPRDEAGGPNPTPAEPAPTEPGDRQP